MLAALGLASVRQECSVRHTPQITTGVAYVLEHFQY